MSEKNKNKNKKGGKESKQQPFPAIDDVKEAVKSFIEENASFQSGPAIEITLDKMAKTSDVNDMFMVPMKEKMLDMQGALVWVMFISVGLRKLADEISFDGFKFDSNAAIKLIGEVYDRDAESSIWAHVYDDEEDDSKSEKSDKE
jgi:hypothetical protein